MTTAATIGTRPYQERRVDDPWKHSVEKDIGDLKKGLTDNTGITQALRAEVSDNTTITKRAEEAVTRVETALAEHARKVQPITDSWESLQAGIATLGKIGNGGKRVGLFVARCAKWVLGCVAAWVFLRHLLHGEGLEAAATAFYKTLSGGK